MICSRLRPKCVSDRSWSQPATCWSSSFGASYDIIVALTGQVECLLGGRRLGHLPALPEEVGEGAPQQPPVGLLIVRHKHPQMRLQGDGLLARGGVDGGGRCDRIRCGLLGATRRDGHAEAERGAARAVLSPRRLYSHLGPEELYELAFRPFQDRKSIPVGRATLVRREELHHATRGHLRGREQHRCE